MLLLLLQVSIVSGDLSPISTCLLKKELYHLATKTCYPPLSPDPCPDGEWVEMGSVPGTGVCEAKTVCTIGEIPVLDQGGGAACGCPHGQERVRGSCQSLFTQGVCGDGLVLLPDNFHVRQKICPSKFSCKRSDKCLGFQKMKTELAPRGSWKGKSKYHSYQI